MLTIRIGDKLYENITDGSEIIGDFDVKNLEFWVVSVNGNALKNVGNKSTAKDSQGRNPLEVNTYVETNGRLTVRLNYHAQDDPVAANQAYPFEIGKLTFASSKADLVTVPTVKKLTGVTVTPLTKSLKITWKKSDVTGYQIQYSVYKNFKSAKTINVAKTKTAYTIKKLGAKKNYYVRIRGYKTYKDDLGKNAKAYGAWTTVNKKTK